ncbi:MAG: LOG family protein [Gammaproteobacteria bacterium]|jgi:predicted Rossmann-fold nucleotide-binding protein|nr:LOG family protein [Gammaproteobacteria bacterium]|tara:strand:+ start:1832 stop:3214 length:1383 start_codon:yes stop_codon:yes gene_type:complete
MSDADVSIRVSPEGYLDILSQEEVNSLLDSSKGGLYHLFRTCSLAVLNCGSDADDVRQLQEKFSSFKIQVLQVERGLRLELHNAPAVAFVEGKMIRGIKEHLFSVLRDIIYVNNEITKNPRFNLGKSKGTTDAVFHILRNAGTLRSRTPPNIVVCWGGHSIQRHEYDYTKEVGYELGLRGMDICTGCGAGAMKGPMKGATIGHAKQRIQTGRYIGITEPGIISSEAPNPIVNELVILPDIEKRLEAFVRIAHGIIIFPGGVGTMEEILYLLGVLLHPKNKKLPFPIVLTASESDRSYIERIDRFIGKTLGKRAQDRYEIIIEDPVRVANTLLAGLRVVRKFRKAKGDAYFFSWTLKMYRDFQQPFLPTHKNVAKLNICKGQPTYKLAADLRRVFSSIVAGNVKEQGIRAIEEHGNYRLTGEPEIMTAMDELLQSFVDEKRMKLPGHDYTPCYEIVSRKSK